MANGNQPRLRVAVVGAGIIGLTSAMALLKDAWDVTVISDEFTPFLTSNKAGALWAPYLCEPRDKVVVWGEETYKTLVRDAKKPEKTGVQMIGGYIKYRRRLSEDDFWFAHIPINFRQLSPSELSEPMDGMYFEAPLVLMATYLHVLMRRLRKKGAKFVRRRIDSLLSLPQKHYDLIVNCAGIGGGAISTQDLTPPYPARGQIHAFAPIPGLNVFLSDEDGEGDGIFTYIFPHKEYTVVGGSCVPNRSDTNIDQHETREILRRSDELFVHGLSKLPVQKQWVGLRPARSAVRLEVEELTISSRCLSATDNECVVQKRYVIQNYGHGGSGITIGWGCASEVSKLAKDIKPLIMQTRVLPAAL